MLDLNILSNICFLSDLIAFYLFFDYFSQNQIVNTIGINIVVMIMTITLTIIFLVALNFILLFTSCNKIPKSKTSQRPYVIKSEKQLVITNQLASSQLAPTGS